MQKNPATQRAVERANVLGALSFRALFEGTRFTPNDAFDEATAKAMAAAVTDWLRDAGLWRALTEPERALLEMTPLAWGREATVAVQGAGLEESTAALLWSLRVIGELPAYDRAVDGEALHRLLPFMSDSPFVTREGMSPLEEYTSMVSSVELHPRAAIEAAERVASAYFWRARSHSLIKAGQLERSRLGAVLEEGASRSRELGIPVDEKGEFLVFGGPYAAVDDRRFALCSRIAESRARTLRWLCSDASWLDVDMSS